MQRNLVGVIVVSAVMCGAVWIYLSKAGTSLDLTINNALGAGVAEETAKLLGNEGQVTVVTPEASAKNPSFQAEWECFQKTLKKNGVSIARTVSFKVATPLELIETGGVLSSSQLLKELQGQAKNGAVVLFCGFPKLTAQEYDTVKQIGAKVIVVSSYQPDYPNLLKANVIELAIVPKSDYSSLATKKAKTLRECFDSEFKVLTTEDLTNPTESR
jgi:hypothetical protein